MALQELDLAHLAVFASIYKHRSVVKAAAELDLSQPTVSRWLAKLREHLNDPLFVRTQAGMEPTPLAVAFSGPISQMLELYQTHLRRGATFDPASSTRTFRIAASDFGHMAVLPRLHRGLTALAPQVSFKAVTLGRQELITGLESGDIDLAVGGFPKLNAGVQEQTLYDDPYVCVMHESNPLLAAPLTLDVYRQARHVLVQLRSVGHVHQVVEQEILDLCPPENIRMVSESFLLAAMMLDGSDLILTAPMLVPRILEKRCGLRSVPPPMALPTFHVKQYWHERFHRDPASQWLRRQVAELVGSGASSES